MRHPIELRAAALQRLLLLAPCAKADAVATLAQAGRAGPSSTAAYDKCEFPTLGQQFARRRAVEIDQEQTLPNVASGENGG